MSDLWQRINEKFGRSPAQLLVIKTLLRYGFSVNQRGIYCGNIKIPDAQIAREAGVDRRVVRATAEAILRDEELATIFSNLRSVAFLRDVAVDLGLGIIEIIPKDASEHGIISEVTGVIAKAGISIRQAITDDPYMVKEAKLTIVTESPVAGDVIEELRQLPTVKSVVVYG